jgi:hypothetical protein
MKAIAIKVRDTICENGEFCETVSQICLISFGASVIGVNLSYLV